MRLRCVFGIFLCALTTAVLNAREWTDNTGNFRVEAELVSVRSGKVYLERPDGRVVSVPLERLSQQDLRHLQSLAEYRDYFRENPLAGDDSGEPTAGVPAEAKPDLVVLEVDDESKVGEVRRFGDLGWGVKSLAFSPDGRLLAVGKMDRAILVYDLTRSQQVARMEDLENLGQVTSLAFTPDGRKLLSGGYSGRIQIWDVDERGGLTEANRFVGHVKAIHTISLTRDGKRVLSGGDGEIARCWELETAREQFSVGGFSRSIRASFITRGGKQGLACDGELVALIDMHDGAVIQTMKLAKRGLQTAAIAPDGSRVVIADGYDLYSWDIVSGAGDPVFEDREMQWFVIFTPDSKFVLSGARGKVNLWDLASHQKIYEFDTAKTSYVQTIAVSPDGRHFAAIPSSAGQDLQVFRMPASAVRVNPAD